MSKFKPMLATTIDFDKLDPQAYYMVSPKLDGIRCLVGGGVAFTRSMKTIPNRYIYKYLLSWFQGAPDDRWFDGELIVGDPTDPMCYRNSVSAVMSEDKFTDDWTYHIFDRVEPEGLSNAAKFREAHLKNATMIGYHINILSQSMNIAGSLVKEECHKYLNMGYEGAMVKPMDAPYKCGRSTPKSMELMKFKAFTDDEAVVVGYVQKEKNMNEAKVNELGHTQRSSHKSGKVLIDQLGSLEVEYKGKVFNIGSGFTEVERQKYWWTRDKLVGKMVKFKFTSYGEYDVPRFPVFLGFRDKRDL